MSFFPGLDPDAGDAAAADLVEHLIIPRSSDLGGFRVQRALPSAQRRLVGPFIFFDRMGPALLESGQRMDVRPHPHIGLSTVTYLFDGDIRHRDSLGTEMVIKPGDINLMTAGRGIVHSERTPDEIEHLPRKVSGLQTWLALPDHLEEMAPAFEHRGNDALPELVADGIAMRLIIGAYAGLTSPVTRHHDTLYADIRLEPAARFPFDNAAEERAVYILDGEISVGGETYGENRLLVFRPGDRLTLKAGVSGAHMMVFGGAALGSSRHIWWNFVSSSKERIEQAKEEWKTGKFDIVPGDEEEFIPLPG